MGTHEREITVDFSRSVGRRESYSWGAGRDGLRPGQDSGNHLLAPYDPAKSGRMSKADFSKAISRFAARHEAPSLSESVWKVARKFEDSQTGQVRHGDFTQKNFDRTIAETEAARSRSIRDLGPSRLIHGPLGCRTRWAPWELPSAGRASAARGEEECKSSDEAAGVHASDYAEGVGDSSLSARAAPQLGSAGQPPAASRRHPLQLYQQPAPARIDTLVPGSRRHPGEYCPPDTYATLHPVGDSVPGRPADARSSSRLSARTGLPGPSGSSQHGASIVEGRFAGTTSANAPDAAGKRSGSPVGLRIDSDGAAGDPWAAAAAASQSQGTGNGSQMGETHRQVNPGPRSGSLARTSAGSIALDRARDQALAILARASNGRGARVGAMLRGIDGDGDGRVTHDQLGRALRNRGLGIEAHHARALAAHADGNGDGVVRISDVEDAVDEVARRGSVPELGGSSASSTGARARNRRGAAFDNLRRALWERIPGQSLSKVLRSVDGNRNGQMDRGKLESCFRAMGVEVKPADMDMICAHPSVGRGEGRVDYVALGNLAAMHSGAEAAVEEGTEGVPDTLGMSSPVLHASEEGDKQGADRKQTAVPGFPVAAAGGPSGRLDVTFGHTTQPRPVASRGMSARITGSVARPFDSLQQHQWTSQHHLHPTVTTQHQDTAKGFDPSHPRTREDVHDAVARERLLQTVRGASMDGRRGVHQIFLEQQQQQQDVGAKGATRTIPSSESTVSYEQLRLRLARTGVPLSSEDFGRLAATLDPEGTGAVRYDRTCEALGVPPAKLPPHLAMNDDSQDAKRGDHPRSGVLDVDHPWTRAAWLRGQETKSQRRLGESADRQQGQGKGQDNDEKAGTGGSSSSGEAGTDPPFVASPAPSRSTAAAAAVISQVPHPADAPAPPGRGPVADSIRTAWQRKWGTSLNTQQQRLHDGYGPDGKPIPPPPLPSQPSAAAFYRPGTSNPLDMTDPAKNPMQRQADAWAQQAAETSMQMYRLGKSGAPLSQQDGQPVSPRRMGRPRPIRAMDAGDSQAMPAAGAPSHLAQPSRQYVARMVQGHAGGEARPGRRFGRARSAPPRRVRAVQGMSEHGALVHGEQELARGHEPSGGGSTLGEQAVTWSEGVPEARHMLARRAWAQRMIMSRPSAYFPQPGDNSRSNGDQGNQQQRGGGVEGRVGEESSVRQQVEGAIQAQQGAVVGLRRRTAIAATVSYDALPRDLARGQLNRSHVRLFDGTMPFGGGVREGRSASARRGRARRGRSVDARGFDRLREAGRRREEEKELAIRGLSSSGGSSGGRDGSLRQHEVGSEPSAQQLVGMIKAGQAEREHRILRCKAALPDGAGALQPRS